MSPMDAYKVLLNGSFGIQMNANDFFNYACAQMVTITDGDFEWVLEHIQKWGYAGMDACIAYIQNQEPIQPHRTDSFEKAIKELVDRKQEVVGDIDWDFHYYNDGGPYRTINKD